MTTTSTLRAHAEQAAARGELLITDPAPVLALLARLDAIAAALRPALEAQQGATEPPWEVDGAYIFARFFAFRIAETWGADGSENAALIVAAVNALPALRAALEGE